MPSITISTLAPRPRAKQASKVHGRSATQVSAGSTASAPNRNVALRRPMMNIGTAAASTAGTIQRWRSRISLRWGKKSTANPMMGNDNEVMIQLKISSSDPSTGSDCALPSKGPPLAAPVTPSASVISAAVEPWVPSARRTPAPARNAVICDSGPRCWRNHVAHVLPSIDQMAGWPRTTVLGAPPVADVTVSVSGAPGRSACTSRQTRSPSDGSGGRVLTMSPTRRPARSAAPPVQM